MTKLFKLYWQKEHWMILYCFLCVLIVMSFIRNACIKSGNTEFSIMEDLTTGDRYGYACIIFWVISTQAFHFYRDKFNRLLPASDGQKFLSRVIYFMVLSNVGLFIAALMSNLIAYPFHSDQITLAEMLGTTLAEFSHNGLSIIKSMFIGISFFMWLSACSQFSTLIWVGVGLFFGFIRNLVVDAFDWTVSHLDSIPFLQTGSFCFGILFLLLAWYQFKRINAIAPTPSKKDN